jgi:hypothetical protein
MIFPSLVKQSLYMRYFGIICESVTVWGKQFTMCDTFQTKIIIQISFHNFFKAGASTDVKLRFVGSTDVTTSPWSIFPGNSVSNF